VEEQKGPRRCVALLCPFIKKRNAIFGDDHGCPAGGGLLTAPTREISRRCCEHDASWD
jgi:hypothetical protein